MSKLHSIARPLIAICCFSIVIGINAAPEGHYRWIDDSGQVKFSDRPPVGVESEFVKFSTGKRTKSSGTNSTSEDESAEAAEKELTGTLEVMPEKDPALCKQAQHNLKALEGARIRITEPDGSKRFLTDEEKEGQRDNARKFIKINC